MSKKIVAAVAIWAVLISLFVTVAVIERDKLSITFHMQTNKEFQLQVFWSAEQGNYNEADSAVTHIYQNKKVHTIEIKKHLNQINFLRIDLGRQVSARITIDSFNIQQLASQDITHPDSRALDKLTFNQDIKLLQPATRKIWLETTGTDPFIEVDISHKYPADFIRYLQTMLVTISLLFWGIYFLCTKQKFGIRLKADWPENG